jgi:uncharacterized glyoxalase superfamily protein PhnB
MTAQLQDQEDVMEPSYPDVIPTVGAHYEHARKAGATVLSELEDDSDGMRYRAEDLKGHRWMLMQR